MSVGHQVLNFQPHVRQTKALSQKGLFTLSSPFSSAKSNGRFNQHFGYFKTVEERSTTCHFSRPRRPPKTGHPGDPGDPSTTPEGPVEAAPRSNWRGKTEAVPQEPPGDPQRLSSSTSAGSTSDEESTGGVV